MTLHLLLASQKLVCCDSLPIRHLGLSAEMEPGHGSPGHRVSDFDRVGSGHGSVSQIDV